MDIKRFETFDPSGDYYNLKDKLALYVMRRSEAAFDRADRARAAIGDRDALEAYTADMRRRFIESLGGLPYDPSYPLNARTTHVIEEEHLTLETVVFTAREGVYVTGTLYLPKQRRTPCGAVLCQCGHATDGKAFGRYQRSCRLIASSGLIVFAIDPVGQGERRSYMEAGFSAPLVPACTTDHQYAGEQCVLAGDCIARYFIADAMRAVDYLCTRPEVDPHQIGVTGTSGGGTASCHMMVCDDRIRAAAPGTFVTSRREYFYAGNPQDSEQIWPGATAFGFDHHELLACFAPKPLLLLAVDSDFFAIEGTREVLDCNRRFWEMYGRGEDIGMHVDRSTHAFTDGIAMAAGRFFAHHLNGEERGYDRNALNVRAVHELFATQTGNVKFDYPDAKFVYDENLARLDEYRKRHDAEAARAYLRACVDRDRTPPAQLGLRRPMNGEVFDRGYGFTPLMWFYQPQLATYALSIRRFDTPSDKPLAITVCLWDNGTNDLESRLHRIRTLCAEGKRVVVVDLAGIGKNTPHDLNHTFSCKGGFGVLDRLTKDLFFLGDSLCALRLFELEQAVRALGEEYGTQDISLLAEGRATVIARLYALLHPDTPIDVRDGDRLVDIAREKYYEDYNVSPYLIPGILKYTDI